MSFSAGAIVAAVLSRRVRSQAESSRAAPGETLSICHTKSSRAAPGNRDISSIRCGMCGQQKPSNAFSAKQQKKHSGWRRAKCNECIATYEATYEANAKSAAAAIKISRWQHRRSP